MTLYGAISNLVMMREHPMMPSMFYSSLDKIIETVSECEEPETNYSEFPNNWIPCSERLPEKEGRYLVWAVVSFTPDHVDEPCEYQQTTIASYFYRRSCWYGEKVEKVIAWQPLPSPYHPEEE